MGAIHTAPVKVALNWLQLLSDDLFETEGSPTVCSARAGNVVGGGDWADDRLLPDISGL